VEAVPPIEILSLQKLHFGRNCEATEEESLASYTLTDRNTHKHHGGTEAMGRKPNLLLKMRPCRKLAQYEQYFLMHSHVTTDVSL
jgi:hypothetical protein